MKSKSISVLALAALSIAVWAQQTVTKGAYMAALETDPKTIAVGIPTTLVFFVTDSQSITAKENLRITASLSMTSMTGMELAQPTVAPSEKSGHFKVSLFFPHPGQYKLTLTVDSTNLGFLITLGTQMSGGMEMKGTLGDWSANREGSGTSWQPDSSPMFMKMLPSLGGFELSAMGIMQAGYVEPGSKRVSPQFFSDSMFMLMGRNETGGGTLGLDFMTSLDPIINGVKGVPDLFQTGETAHGVPLVDRQHPHNLFSELAASYSHSIGKSWSAFFYGGPVGEPALGGVMYLHRDSGLEIPEAPISHHWFDSTHISFGVATVGLVFQDKWKVEGSVFNGHEPGENRYTIGPEGLNSASGRISYNPSRDWSFCASYGFLNSPEALEPGVDEHRLTVSAAYSHDLGHGDNISATAYFGRNDLEGNATPSDAWLAEATYFHRRESVFARFERVDKDELYSVPPGNYVINKLVFGDVHTFCSHDQLDWGVGAYGGVYAFPGSLDPYYGKRPFTLGLFLRVRPSRM